MFGGSGDLSGGSALSVSFQIGLSLNFVLARMFALLTCFAHPIACMLHFIHTYGIARVILFRER